MTVRHSVALWMAALAIAVASSGAQTQAAILASTSFENETPGGSNVNAATDATGGGIPLGTGVDVVNSDGSLADSTGDSAAAGDLGFDATWVNTRDDVGLSDGDFIGVTGFTGDVGSFPDLSQGYQISDADGALVLTFDPVDLSGAMNVVVSVDYFVNSTGYETDPADLFSIIVETDAGNFTILDTTGQDIDDLGIEGTWITGSVSLPDAATTAQLIVTGDTNAGSESIYLDNVVFEAIPEPAAFASGIAGLFGLLVMRRRRR